MTFTWSQQRLSYQLLFVNLRMACQQPLSQRLKVVVQVVLVMAIWMLFLEIHPRQVIVRQIIALNGLTYLSER